MVNYLTHSWEDKGVHTFPKGICPKVNVIAWTGVRTRSYSDSAVHRFNHYTTRRTPQKLNILKFLDFNHSFFFLHFESNFFLNFLFIYFFIFCAFFFSLLFVCFGLVGRESLSGCTFDFRFRIVNMLFFLNGTENSSIPIRLLNFSFNRLFKISCFKF